MYCAVLNMCNCIRENYMRRSCMLTKTTTTSTCIFKVLYYILVYRENRYNSRRTSRGKVWARHASLVGHALPEVLLAEVLVQVLLLLLHRRAQVDAQLTRAIAASPRRIQREHYDWGLQRLHISHNQHCTIYCTVHVQTSTVQYLLTFFLSITVLVISRTFQYILQLDRYNRLNKSGRDGIGFSLLNSNQ